MGIGEKGTCFRIGLWPLDIFGVVFGLVGSTVVFQVYVDLIVTKYKRTRRMEDSKIRKGWGRVIILIPYLSRGRGRPVCVILCPHSAMPQSYLGTPID
jgi:hypothetical protein